MNNILDILRRSGGWRASLYVKIPNPPYMDLVVEAVGEPGPKGLPSISVAHCGVQNGDLMRDPEMCFELTSAGLDPFCWRYDHVAVEQWSRNLVCGNYVFLKELHHSM